MGNMVLSNRVCVCGCTALWFFDFMLVAAEFPHISLHDVLYYVCFFFFILPYSQCDTKHKAEVMISETHHLRV